MKPERYQDQCLYCGRPIGPVGDGPDGSMHRFAGGWTGSVHDEPSRCSKSAFVPQSKRHLGRTSELESFRAVYLRDGSTTYVTGVGVLTAESREALQNGMHREYVVVTQDGQATLCGAEDMWVIARSTKAPDFLAWTIESIDEVDALDPAEFERLVADLIYLQDCRILQEHGMTNDKGADVIALSLSGRRIVVQCKRWRKRVGFDDLAKVGGTARQLHAADDVWVVALNGFTPEARNYARRQHINLVGRAELAAWLAGDPPADFAV